MGGVWGFEDCMKGVEYRVSVRGKRALILRRSWMGESGD